MGCRDRWSTDIWRVSSFKPMKDRSIDFTKKKQLCCRLAAKKHHKPSPKIPLFFNSTPDFFFPPFGQFLFLDIHGDHFLHRWLRDLAHSNRNHWLSRIDCCCFFLWCKFASWISKSIHRLVGDPVTLGPSFDLILTLQVPKQHFYDVKRYVISRNHPSFSCQSLFTHFFVTRVTIFHFLSL